MNYQNVYKLLVERASTSNRSKSPSDYWESHHIIPKCLGGSNKKCNLVLLSAREHFIAHRLLVKIYPNSQPLKRAVFFMSHDVRGRGVKVTSRCYALLRQDLVNVKLANAGHNQHLKLDTSIPIYVPVSTMIRGNKKIRCSLTIKKAIKVVTTGALAASYLGTTLSYSRATGGSKERGKVSKSSVIKAVDMLASIGYLVSYRSDINLPVSCRQISYVKPTEEFLALFTTKHILGCAANYGVTQEEKICV